MKNFQICRLFSMLPNYFSLCYLWQILINIKQLYFMNDIYNSLKLCSPYNMKCCESGRSKHSNQHIETFQRKNYKHILYNDNNNNVSFIHLNNKRKSIFKGQKSLQLTNNNKHISKPTYLQHTKISQREFFMQKKNIESPKRIHTSLVNNISYSKPILISQLKLKYQPIKSAHINYEVKKQINPKNLIFIKKQTPKMKMKIIQSLKPKKKLVIQEQVLNNVKESLSQFQISLRNYNFNQYEDNQIIQQQQYKTPYIRIYDSNHFPGEFQITQKNNDLANRLNLYDTLTIISNNAQIQQQNGDIENPENLQKSYSYIGQKNDLIIENTNLQYIQKLIHNRQFEVSLFKSQANNVFISIKQFKNIAQCTNQIKIYYLLQQNQHILSLYRIKNIGSRKLLIKQPFLSKPIVKNIQEFEKIIFTAKSVLTFCQSFGIYIKQQLEIEDFVESFGVYKFHSLHKFTNCQFRKYSTISVCENFTKKVQYFLS